MKKFQFYNNVVGWAVFLIAAIVYILTIEPTASFWDCGEFITTAFKLEVGHPPGAPLFMIMGRIFTLFAFGNKELVPVMVNVMSALASAFTILFLFWTISHMARKILVKIVDQITPGQIIAILGSGAVGALAYTFSDTFWFSAVEGEVYASSSLFTAVVFWAILKWENEANEKFANRWLILISYLMGLSIGVHLLNLLAIPSIVFLYYFKKYKISTSGIIKASLVAILALGGLMYGIIPYVVKIAAYFELIFTNGFGMPFNTGALVYSILVVGGIIWGIWFTYQKRKIVLNTVILCFAVIIIGYCSFAMIIIRSAADTPMDQNNPDNAFALLSYLNREQYGDRPLVFGQTFNAQPVGYDEIEPIYAQKGGKYVEIDKKLKYEYESSHMTLFPRMYSDQPNHIAAYISWAGLDGNAENPPTDPPTFFQNMKFFFKYQVNFMYLRYFMWNYAGRQNDIQGNGEINHGNWMSGVSFIDEMRIGNMDKYPNSLGENKAYNKYYFLPLILGLVGLFFQYKNHRNDFWVTLLLFFFTGLAIVIYLNQTPYQPRERDYAYAGSFYAFSIWIGLGVLGIFTILKKYSSEATGGIIATVVSMVVPGILLAENWDDHDRSNRYTARDFAHNYLNSCAKNAILFTNGDNDTFPLWYAQEVEGVRTDVRVINLSYLSTDWYINQMKRKAYDSDPVPFSLKEEHYEQGTRDMVRINEQPSLFLEDKLAMNKRQFDQSYSQIYDNLMRILNSSKFPELNEKDYQLLNKGKDAVNPLQTNSLINTLAKPESVSKYAINVAFIDSLKKYSAELVSDIVNSPVELKKVMSFLTSDSPDTKIQRGDEIESYIPVRTVGIKADPNKMVELGVVKKEDKNKVSSVVSWKLPGKYIRKNDMMILDLMATNDWKRPVYFAITVGNEGYLNLDEWFRIEGLAYRVVPIRTVNNDGQTGNVDTELMYDNMMNKFKWGGINNPKVYLDENNIRMVMNFRNNFARLAMALINEKQKDKAIKVLDRCQELMPNNLVPYNYYSLLVADAYYEAGVPEKGNEILSTLATICEDDLDYYLSLGADFTNRVDDEDRRAGAIFQEIVKTAKDRKQEKLAEDLEKKFQNLLLKYNYTGEK